MNPNPTEDSPAKSRLAGAAIQPRDAWWQRVWTWIRAHPVLTVIILLVLYLLGEFLWLPTPGQVEKLRTENPRSTALMEARKHEHRSDKRPWTIRQRWLPLSRISPHLIHAVIVAEDGAFYEHEGFDWYEVRQSIEKNIQKGRLARGASTITQQLAKNLFLSTSKDPIRKLKEAVVTTRLESALSKNRLLEIYLNIIELGDGVFGVEMGARKYFAKSASDLTREEAARLAAVIPNPLRHRPDVDSRYVHHRQRIILTRMETRGW